jgi:hypothetical protein
MRTTGPSASRSWLWDGEVIEVVDGIADNAPSLPMVTMHNLMGNRVLLRVAPDMCVTYGHLKQGHSGAPASTTEAWRSGRVEELRKQHGCPPAHQVSDGSASILRKASLRFRGVHFWASARFRLQPSGRRCAEPNLARRWFRSEILERLYTALPLRHLLTFRKMSTKSVSSGVTVSSQQTTLSTYSMCSIPIGAVVDRPNS